MPLPDVVTERHELRGRIAELRRGGKSLGFVPTMGALHAGHLSLVEASNQACDLTAVSIFVNPTQFGPNEDLAKYPRTLTADLAALATRRVDLVFAPPVEQIYPPGHDTFVEVGAVGRRWEGAARPVHFRGVATVVLKLFNLVQPDVAFFGQKDFQQCLVVQKLVADFDLPLEIRVCPTVREPDGLAMSSRNAYLSADQRASALSLSRALHNAEAAVASGERRVAVLLDQLTATLQASAGVVIDYAAIADRATLEPLESIDRPAVALLAARVGATRLIDNVLLDAT